ncbi:MAG: DUF3824 domain-containing protein [Propionibacteriaceae bacterium]|nr:DUF3824 domain-containing protein [Propionibacteriaceae bacterium]
MTNYSPPPVSPQPGGYPPQGAYPQPGGYPQPGVAPGYAPGYGAMPMSRPRNTFLFVVSIVLCVFAAISVIGVIFEFIVVAELADWIGPLAWILVFLDLLIVGFVIFASIVGIKDSANPNKAKFLMIIGIIYASIALVTFILKIVGGQNVGLAIVGLILPILYVVAAIMHKNFFGPRIGVPQPGMVQPGMPGQYPGM